MDHEGAANKGTANKKFTASTEGLGEKTGEYSCERTRARRTTGVYTDGFHIRGMVESRQLEMSHRNQVRTWMPAKGRKRSVAAPLFRAIYMRNSARAGAVIKEWVNEKRPTFGERGDRKRIEPCSLRERPEFRAPSEFAGVKSSVIFVNCHGSTTE
jgi:hypothetical protein